MTTNNPPAGDGKDAAERSTEQIIVRPSLRDEQQEARFEVARRDKEPGA